MANSSPAPRPSQWSNSEEPTNLHDFLSPDRNTELSHLESLHAADALHLQVQKNAFYTLELAKQQDEQRRLLEEQQKEKDRLQVEREVAAEAARLQALRAKHVPKPQPPEPEPEPEPPKPQRQQHFAPHQANQANLQSLQQQASDQAATGTAARPNAPKQSPAQPVQAAQPFQVPHPPLPLVSINPPQSTSSPFATAHSNGTSAGAPPLQPPQQQQQPPPVQSTPAQAGNTNGPVNGVTGASPRGQQLSLAQIAARYVEIHKNLKQLRRSMNEELKVNPQLKRKMGDMRREIRKSMGQLTVAKGGNAQPVSKITECLRSALQGSPPSHLVDPSLFVLIPRLPAEGATRNEPQLPSLFIYLTNIVSKAVINQFINECGANPTAADPIGTAVARIMSEPDFLWRGKSMIDILLAKLRIVCPVLFGFRGNDKTERGRQNVGWRKDGPGWIPEQQHFDRMTGLGAGFASISLRDFSRVTSRANPYTPNHYWMALARIINTPPAEISSTQCIVLKAMIEGHEAKLLKLFGAQGKLALRAALVDFPAKVQEKSPAVVSLEVLASLLRKKAGLVLA